MPEVANTEVHREKHYLVAELAELWSVSSDTIRRLFRREPGVVVISRADHTGKRCRSRYESLRIPESVVRRVHLRLSNPNPSAASMVVSSNAFPKSSNLNRRLPSVLKTATFSRKQQ